MGCWTPVETFGLDDAAAAGGKPFDWSARLVEADGSVFAVLHAGSEIGTVRWPLLGRHNVMNALSALAARRAVGVDRAAVIPALARFRKLGGAVWREGGRQAVWMWVVGGKV